MTPVAPPVAVGNTPEPADVPVDRPTYDYLLKLAPLRPEYAWDVNAPIADAYNAHYTNRRDHMKVALTGTYNSLEGDVRLRDGVPVMAHRGSATPQLTFEQWATIGAASGKFLRIDVKEPAALDGILATLGSMDVPQQRLAFNVTTGQPWQGANLPIERVQALRATYPDAWITFNTPAPVTRGYEAAARTAAQIGGKVGVSVLTQLAGNQLVDRIKSYGVSVNVWNAPELYVPRDIDRERARLRSIGVDGMIDLRRRDDPLAFD